ncbi:MAG: hypothetical protein C4551_10130 [Bacillota bacterium]|nr:MAG: hypothetical protein C4551_10130 [Bacillota bacterium]
MQINLTEIGKRISAATASQIRAAITALEALLAVPEATGGDESKEATEALRQLQEAEMSFDDIKSLLRAAIRNEIDPAGKRWIYVRDVYPQAVVYEDEGPSGSVSPGKLYRRSYALVDNKVTLGEPEEVVAVTTYEPVKKAQESAAELPTEEGGGDPAAKPTEISEGGADTELIGDCVELIEAKVRRDGTIPVRLITPGWGTSGYYPKEVLQRDGPKVFKSGMHMYWNHPTKAEEAGRPERDLRDLAAVLAEDAKWQEQGPKGPGLYASAKVFGAYQKPVEELAEHIGLSIRGGGLSKEGEAEGRKGPIVEAITLGKSVDFVTRAGRGGEILSLFEAARPGRTDQKEGDQVDLNLQQLVEAKAILEEKVSRLEARNAELEAKVKRFEEGALLAEARSFVAEALGRVAGMPDLTRNRLVEALAANPPVAEGKLDREAFAKQIAETAKQEMAYLEAIVGSGKIRGMGPSEGGEPAALQDSERQIEESFKRLGLNESAAKIAAAGRR